MYLSRIISETSQFFLLCNPFWKLMEKIKICRKGDVKLENGIFV